MPNQDYKDFKQIEDEKKRGAELPVLSKEENEQRSKHIRKMRDAQQTRDGSRKEFDGMDYVTRYETSLQADMSYIPPKLNKGDVRVVTGTTREKNNSLLAALLNYNFEASITAYDKNNNEIDELGSHLADLVRKSRELEDYDSKRDMIYRELLTQGDVFGMDSLITKFRVKRNADFNWEKGVDIKKFEVSENLELEYKRPEFTMLSGTKVFLGNIREPLIQNQPFIVVVETEPYEVVKTQFQKWERWKFVPKKIARLQDTTDVSGYRDWSLLTTKDNYCEKIWYMDRPTNTLQLYLNGVPMLPVGFPLDEVSPSGLYPIAQGSCEKVPFFAYAKGIAEKMKVDQAIIDEFFKLAILKQQQSYRPTLANNTGSELSPDIYMAGTVIDNIDSEKIKPIFPTNGMSQPDVMFLQYMKEIMDSKSVSPMMTGESTGQGRMTAAQYLDQKRQSLQKLGLIVWGIVKFEQHVNWLRLQSILKYGLGDGFSEDTLITVKTTLENGKKGQRVFEFNGDMTKIVSPEQVRIESELLTARYGMETRKVYLDWNGLKKANLTFRVNVVPTEKNTSELNQMLLTNKIRDAAELFGPQSMNLGYWEELWAMKNDVDFSRAFNQAPQMAGAGGVLNGQPQQPNTQGTPDFSNIGPKAVINNENPALRAK